jgi:hypothetical protein
VNQSSGRVNTEASSSFAPRIRGLDGCPCAVHDGRAQRKVESSDPLIRAADDAIDGGHRFDTMMIDESNDCFGDFWIASRIGCFAKPPLNRFRVSIFVRDDANRDLRRSLVVWPVEGNRCHWIAAEALATFFCELVLVPLSLEMSCPLPRMPCWVT